jgi:hypothetical protein
LERPCQKSIPSSLFQREESFGGFDGEFLPLFPPLKKGMKGDVTAFQKAKRLRRAYLPLILKLRRSKMKVHWPTEKLAFILCLIVVAAMGCAALTPGKSGEAQKLSKEQLLSMLGNTEVVILDVREAGSWKDSRMKIKGAVREDPEKDVQGWFDKYPKDKTLVFYCS